MPPWLLIAGKVIEALYYVFKYGPDIVGLVREIAQLIKRLSDGDKPTYSQALAAAVETFHKTGDRTPLRDLRDHLHDRCFGKYCIEI